MAKELIILNFGELFSETEVKVYIREIGEFLLRIQGEYMKLEFFRRKKSAHYAYDIKVKSLDWAAMLPGFERLICQDCGFMPLISSSVLLHLSFII